RDRHVRAPCDRPGAERAPERRLARDALAAARDVPRLPDPPPHARPEARPAPDPARLLPPPPPLLAAARRDRALPLPRRDGGRSPPRDPGTERRRPSGPAGDLYPRDAPGLPARLPRGRRRHVGGGPEAGHRPRGNHPAAIRPRSG